MDINKQNSISVGSKIKLHLLLFSTSWSKPCIQQLEILTKLPNNTETTSIDIDRSPELADRWAIQSIPTTILLKENREVNRFIGLLSADKLQDILAECSASVGQVPKGKQNQRS